MAVDREFACILFMCISFCDLLVSFGCLWDHLALLGSTLGLLLKAFGAPWAAKGLSLASLSLPFGSLGTPWDHLGHLGLPSGAWADLGQQWTSNSEQMALKYATCAQKVTSRN